MDRERLQKGASDSLTGDHGVFLEAKRQEQLLPAARERLTADMDSWTKTYQEFAAICESTNPTNLDGPVLIPLGEVDVDLDGSKVSRKLHATVVDADTEGKQSDRKPEKIYVSFFIEGTPEDREDGLIPHPDTIGYAIDDEGKPWEVFGQSFSFGEIVKAEEVPFEGGTPVWFKNPEECSFREAQWISQCIQEELADKTPTLEMLKAGIKSTYPDMGRVLALKTGDASFVDLLKVVAEAERIR